MDKGKGKQNCKENSSRTYFAFLMLPRRTPTLAAVWWRFSKINIKSKRSYFFFVQDRSVPHKTVSKDVDIFVNDVTRNANLDVFQSANKNIPEFSCIGKAFFRLIRNL